MKKKSVTVVRLFIKEKINSLAMNASATVQGMTIETITLAAKGGKTSVEMKMMGQSMQKRLFSY